MGSMMRGSLTEESEETKETDVDVVPPPDSMSQARVLASLKEVCRRANDCLVQAKLENQAANSQMQNAKALEMVKQGLSYSVEHASNMTADSLLVVSDLHRIEACALFGQGDILGSMRQLDVAIMTSDQPAPQMMQFAIYWYQNFVGWCRNNWPSSSQEISALYKEHQRRITKILSLVNKPKSSELLFMETSSLLGQFIWSMNPSGDNKEFLIRVLLALAKQNLAAVLLQQTDPHGFLSVGDFQLIKLQCCNEHLRNAEGLGAQSVEFHQLAASVHLTYLRLIEPDRVQFRNKYYEGLKHVTDGLRLRPENHELLELKKELTEVHRLHVAKLAAPPVLQPVDNKTLAKEDPFLRELELQKRRAEEVKKAHETKKKKKVKTREVRRDRSAPVSPPKDVVQNGHADTSDETRSEASVESSSSTVDLKISLVGSNRNNNVSNKNASNSNSRYEILKKGKAKGVILDLVFMKNVNGQAMKTDLNGEVIDEDDDANSTKKPKLRPPSGVSMDTYMEMIQTYHIYLACGNCVDRQDADVVLCSECSRSRLVVSCINDPDSERFEIRPCPKKFKGDVDCELCESFLRNEQCMEKYKCPNPHSDDERMLWCRYFSDKLTIEKFVDDLCNSSLRIRYNVESICRRFLGCFVFVCKQCLQNGDPPKKKRHDPCCRKDHYWQDNRIIAFEKLSQIGLLEPKIISLDLKNNLGKDAKEAAKIRKELNQLLETGITEVEFVAESHRLLQTILDKDAVTSCPGKIRPPEHPVVVERERGTSACDDADAGLVKTKDEVGDGEVDENPSFDENLEDAMSVCDSDEDDNDQFYEQDKSEDSWNNYYDLMSDSYAEECLITKPHEYKRCTISLDGPFNANCKILNPGLDDEEVEQIREDFYRRAPERALDFEQQKHFEYDPNDTRTPEEKAIDDFEMKLREVNDLRQVEIRGRMNCGPCFEGDEVAVELRPIKELDKETHVYRGTVRAILRKSIRRTKYTFLCRVDAFFAHLMKPIDGIAPKIHIVKTVIIENYYERRNELVAIYAKDPVDGLKLKKIIKLNPKKRRDMLFVVKYLRWENTKMYPLGYVTNILYAGQGLEDSQRVLNILYQVPTKPNEECHLAAKALQQQPQEDPHRLDLTKRFTVTIDPATCRDIDDALSIKRLPNEQFEVGVHIADVSYYVKKDDVIDKNARRRGTSFYPATNTVYHMLPEHLSENLCSLRQGEDRFTLSILWKMNQDGEQLCPPIIRKTKICSNHQMNYEQAQEIIESHDYAQPLIWKNNDLKAAILSLHHIAQRLRWRRQRDGAFNYQIDEQRPFCTKPCHDAHRLVEEFMILANFNVAQFLAKNYPDGSLFRIQLPPDENEVSHWMENNGDIALSSFYFKQFQDLMRMKMVQMKAALMQKKNAENEIDEETTGMSKIYDRQSSNGISSENRRRTNINKNSCDSSSSVTIPILFETLKALQHAAETEKVDDVRSLVGTEALHPLHNLAMIHWFCIQNPAQFAVISKQSAISSKHFSLQIPAYVQFTSPIRRFTDVIIHRFVKAALELTEAPYTVDELQHIRIGINSLQSKPYGRACSLLKTSMLLREDPFFLPCFVQEFDDAGFQLSAPYLRMSRKKTKTIKYSDLSVSGKPSIKDNKVKLTWERRMYDTHVYHNFARNLKQCKSGVILDGEKHTADVSVEEWRLLQSFVIAGDVNKLKEHIEGIMDTASNSIQSRMGYLDVTSEMQDNVLMIKHHARFDQTVQRGTVLAVQFGAESTMGFVQPVPRLVNLTESKDICIEHRTDPVSCFAELATEKVVEWYPSMKGYQDIWLPILAMEAATKTGESGDTILCDHVNVRFQKRNDKYYGTLEIPLAFCKKRKMKIFNNSKDGEEDANDYMCIQYKRKDPHATKHSSPEATCRSFVRNVWIGHAVALYVHVDENEDVRIKFEIKRFSTAIPSELLEADRHGVKCSIEFLTKTLPDRRMEDAVVAIPDASKLCQRIVEGRKIDEFLDDLVYPHSDTYDLGMTQEQRKLTKIYLNNQNQTDVIRAALRGQFTLIQGPPGTGKTVTAIKLAYWYVQMNRANASNNQVLYCGPSNSSVDVAAKMLKKLHCLGDTCPRIVRVYSEVLECQVFPIPRDTVQAGSQKGRRYELIDKEENRDIALHHLIRENGKEFSQQILAFDKLFRNNKPEEITDKQVEIYQKLITDASIHELKSYDIVFCTCATSVSPRMIRSLNVKQIIIDECGMCMEPESLIPIVGYKSANQIALIGDHKQLRPIVTNKTACNLGMEKSLFERYHERARMLTKQYRMHPGICTFPSNYFYDSLLVSARPIEDFGIPLPHWPKRRHPMVFCHIEGAESIQKVSTEEGHIDSRSNEAEIQEAQRIYLRLANPQPVKTGRRLPNGDEEFKEVYEVNPERICILTQYQAQRCAIERNLKKIGYQHPIVNTIIASQGDEWDYVIISLVRSMPQYEIEKKPSEGWCQKNMGFITDEHQINVALTRARLGLIIIGNKHLLSCNRMWKELLFHFDRLGVVMESKQLFAATARRAFQTRQIAQEEERRRRDDERRNAVKQKKTKMQQRQDNDNY